MPALSNPRHEAFAQAIFAGLTGKTRIDRAQSTAYLKAYPNCSSGNSAEACASRLLRNAKPILDRVREANKRLEPKLDLSRERIGRRLDKASLIAEEQGNPSAMAASELGIAKVFHSTQDQEQSPFDFKNATSMYDIGRKLLMSVGYENADDASIALAIEANDAFVDRLEGPLPHKRVTRLRSQIRRAIRQRRIPPRQSVSRRRLPSKPGNSADSAASSGLRKFKGILDRVRELVAEANARNQHKIDLSRARIGRDLDKASRLAEEQGNASAIDKVFHSLPSENESHLDFKSAQSMHDIGRKLLMTVGMENPDDASIALAVEANDAFIQAHRFAAHNPS